MKTKTIKSALSKKFNDWLETIDCETTRELARNNTIITGGAIVSMLLNEPPNDYDLYFRNKETIKALAKYYVDKWNEKHGALENKIGNKEKLFVLDGDDVEKWKKDELNLMDIAPNYKENYNYLSQKNYVSHMITNTPPGRIKIIYPSDGIITGGETIEILDDLDEMNESLLEPEQNSKDKSKEKYKPIFITTNAISLSNKVQLILRFYGEPNIIHNTYDFEHCCCHWDSKSKQLVTPEKSLLAILNKDLFYKGSEYPLCAMIRTKKFIKRGWKINAGQFVKIAFQISRLDLTNIDILEDQLIGVDTIYFKQVVNALRNMKENNPDFSFDETYLASIIDRIF